MSKSASKPPRGEEGADREGGTTAKKNQSISEDAEENKEKAEREEEGIDNSSDCTLLTWSGSGW